MTKTSMNGYMMRLKGRDEGGRTGGAGGRWKCSGGGACHSGTILQSKQGEEAVNQTNVTEL